MHALATPPPRLRAAAALGASLALMLTALATAMPAQAAALVGPTSPSQFIAGTGAGGCPTEGADAATSPVGDLWDAIPDAAGNTYITSVECNRVYKIDAEGKISTFAGSGVPGWDGDGGPATAAKLCRPIGLALSATDLYFSEQGTNDTNLACEPFGRTVRKVNLSTGIITTIAGQPGQTGTAGDNGPAASSTLNSPAGLALDTGGNLYIADYDASRIRKIDTSGTISLYKDLTAGPRQIAFDSAGAMYYALANDHAVYKYDGTTTTTIANTGASSLPEGVAVDSGGNVYVTDRGSGSGFGQSIHVIRSDGSSTYGSTSLVSASSTGCSSGATASQLQVSYPWLMHISADGKSLFVAIGGCSRIARFGPAVGAPVDIAATVKAPSGSSTVGDSPTLGQPSTTEDSGGASVTFAGGDAAPVCTLVDGSGSPITLSGSTAAGTYSTTCSGAVKAGYAFTYTSGSWTVNEPPYVGTGYFAPIDKGVHNTVKAGNAVPLKFRVFRGGVEITNPALLTFKVALVSCATLTGTDSVEELSAGATALRYDTTSRQFIHNWRTPSNRGKCYVASHAIGSEVLVSADFMTK